MKAVIIVLIALAAVVNAFNALPFGLDGTEYFFSSDSNSLSKSSQITIRGTNIGIPLEAGYNTSFTVSPGTRLTGELECRDDKTQSILPSSTVSLEEGLYKIRVTGTRGVTAKDTISFTCGPLSVASSVYDKNNDPQTISVSSVKGASTHSSKVFPKPPPMAISATPSLATFQYGVGKSGYMEFKFPKSLYPLNVSTKHHYFMVDFPHAVKVFNPSGERDQQVCYDPTNSEVSVSHIMNTIYNLLYYILD